MLACWDRRRVDLTVTKEMGKNAIVTSVRSRMLLFWSAACRVSITDEAEKSYDKVQTATSALLHQAGLDTMPRKES